MWGDHGLRHRSALTALYHCLDCKKLSYAGLNKKDVIVIMFGVSDSSGFTVLGALLDEGCSDSVLGQGWVGNMRNSGSSCRIPEP